jgi:hypothetical protein
MINGYSNRNLTNDPPFSYTKDGNNRVNVRGALTPGVQTDGTIIESTALPVGYRPLLYMHIAIRSGGNGYNLTAQDTSGNMLAKGGSAGTAVFMNYSFLSTAYTGTWNTPTMIPGWVAHTPATYSTPQYTKSADGMVTLKGLIKSGTAGGSIAFQLPPGFRPANTALMDSICNGLWCRIDIRPTGDVYMSTGTSTVWSSLDGLTFMAEQ